MRSSRSRAAALLALVALSGATMADVTGALAQSSILHEFIPPDPGEDVSLATTTLDGNLPAAIDTPSGVATAPDPRRPAEPERAYGGAATSDSPDATYEPDRDTRRPHVESYDDPFSPATAPFKRLRAYDAVNADYSLRVRDKSLRPLPIGGAVDAGDEAFYGDFSVDVAADQPVRIPTVGPGARVLKMLVSPPMPLEVLHDGADNWFVRGRTPARVRLIVELAIPRATFGSPFADVSFAELERKARIEPPPNRAAFDAVASAVGISRSMRPREVVSKMVEYFRSFAPSDDSPQANGDIYLDLALSRKGVCRHRAFAFLVTALAIGIPSRMVVNEAHAWVEAFDGTLWHRIDLGGAAQNLENENDPSRPPYVPPPDPYAWPEGQDSGQDLVDRTRSEQQAESGQSAGVEPPPSALTPPPPTDAEGAAASGASDKPASVVAITATDKDARRGYPFHLRGEVATPEGPCAHSRVDVVLVGPDAPDGAVIGSLSTDDRGAFDGAVVISQSFSLGDYDLVVVAPGDAQCGWGRSE